MTQQFNGRPFAVFDIDGTLFRWSMMLYAIELLTEEGNISDEVLAESHRLRRAWKRRDSPVAYERYVRHSIFAFEDRLGKGLTRADMQRVSRRVIDEHGEKVYVFTRSLLRAAQEEGYLTIALSHSSQEVVELFAEKWKFDIAMGTVAHVDDHGVYTGTRVLPTKLDELEALIAKHGLDREGSIGVGDTTTDVPMIMVTDIPILFNPSNEMVEAAMIAAPRRGSKALPPTIVVERKNVIWTRAFNPFRNFTTVDVTHSLNDPFPLGEALMRRLQTHVEEAGYGFY